MAFNVCTADFGHGTNGNTITGGDTGGLTAWDGAGPATGGTLKYDTTHVAFGSLAAKLIGGATGANTLRWGASGGAALGSGTEQWGRAYIYPTVYPGGSINLLRFLNVGGDIGALVLNADGTIGNSSNTVPLNQWSRVEWHAIHLTSGGTLDVKIYQFADSTTATETKTIVSGNTGAACDELDIGNSGSGGALYTHWLDQLVAGAGSYPGPFPVSTIAPTVAGATAVGSVLFCDGGTWNGGAQFTLTYQWTRDGSNIGAATASAYTTVTADSGHAVGCTVTATGLVATNEAASQASSNTINVGSGPPPVIGGSLTVRTLARA